MAPEVIVMGIIGIIVLAAIITGVTLKIDKGVVSVEPKGKGPRKRQNPHAICGHVKDVIKVFRDRDDYKDRIAEIEHRCLPKEIMQASEDAIERIMALLTGYYLSLLKNLGIAAQDDVASTDQFRSYTIILEALRPYLIQECRRMMHENGWLKKEADGVFDTYVKQKVADFITSFTRLLNDYYIIETPTRIQVFEHNRSKLHDNGGIAEIMEYTIRQFLVISRNWQKEIDAVKRKMDADMRTILGD